MNIKLPCWGIYLRLLLGCRRSCCTAASAAAMAAPASSRWVWVTLVLLWLRDGPWERRWPSEEDFELPGLLWDFSMVGTCMSGYKRVKRELTLLRRSTFLPSSPASHRLKLRFMVMRFPSGLIYATAPYSVMWLNIWEMVWGRRVQRIILLREKFEKRKCIWLPSREWLLSYMFSKQLLPQVGTRQETKGWYHRRGAVSKNTENSWKKGPESLGLIK